MLEKLVLNKILFFALVVLTLPPVFGCAKHQNIDTSTEILCPNGSKTLIKFSRLQDVREAIYYAYHSKKAEHTSENYTPIRLADGRSFRIEKVFPEEAIKCFLRETPVGLADPWYIRHF